MGQPAQNATRRSAGVVALAVALLAVLVLAGLGAADSLRAGTRAERVRGLAPFTAALTALVRELQRERSLSAEPSAGPAGRSTRPRRTTATPPSGSRSPTATHGSTSASTPAWPSWPA